MASKNRPANRLIVLELNELCGAFVDRFMAEGCLPNFRRLRDRSTAFITHTDEAKLEPWIQWVTLHTGVPLDEHGIHDLDEAGRLRHPAYWDALDGDNLLLMSPMNVKLDRDDDSIFMPDPWTATQAPSKDVEPLFRFVRATVNRHMRSRRLGLAEGLAAARFLAGHGLSFATVEAVVRQLADERLGARDVGWRRATILDRLAWDVFAHYWRSRRHPRVGVFFSNATAHFQHKYWRHFAPESFGLAPDEGELAAYGDAIRYGYMAHDRIIGRALDLAGDDCAVALCTALSQQPMLDYEARGGKAMFLPKDLARLMRALGVSARVRDEKIMAEESRAVFESAADCAKAYETCEAATTSDGRRLFALRGCDERSFILGCAVLASEVSASTRIASPGFASCAFHDHFVPMPTVTSGKHHPEGLFWLANPRAPRAAGVSRLPLTKVRAQLEQALGIPEVPTGIRPRAQAA